jgi:hypothetical protein
LLNEYPFLKNKLNIFKVVLENYKDLKFLTLSKIKNDYKKFFEDDCDKELTIFKFYD